jgi:hypothetical protein
MTTLTRRHLLGGLAAGAICSPVAAIAASHPARVMVIASMHKRHATSSSYTYDHLYAAVAHFAPNLVGVEIRQEDLGRSEDYLARNYPAEMIHLARAYPGRVVGFDWLGDDVAGRAVPDDWWRAHSPIKKLEREMDAELPDDARHKRLTATLTALSQKQDAILADATVTSLSDGRYDRITTRYYTTLRALTAGTRFAALPAFYHQRDERIIANILVTARAHPGDRIVIVTGADHHGPVVSALARHPQSVSLAPVTP